jgi:SAM-dependent methyltransferase
MVRRLQTMPAPSEAYDWANTRGEHWRAEITRMEAMLAPVDDPLIAALMLDRPLRIAEIGSGGGGTALEISRRAPHGSFVQGLDISPALVEAARARLPHLTRKVAFDCVDAATAPPPAELYDRLVSRFGIMFFDDAPAAFANLSRWLVPGGRAVFAVWGPPSENPWISVVRDVVAGIVGLSPPEPDAPGPFRYGNVETLLTLLARAGFSDLQKREWRHPLLLGGGLPAAEAASFALASFSSFADLLAKAGADAVDRARRELTARFAGHERGGAVRMDALVHIVLAARS